jgi:glycosyltransferase involved in cell wall biosynthesis
MQGGVGDFSRELALALAGLGNEVHVIAHRQARAETPLKLHPMVETWGPGTLLAVRRLARALSLDLINIQYQAAAYGMTAPIHFLPRAAGLPAVVTFHDLRVPYLFPKAGPLRRAAVNFMARSASGVIGTNPEDRLALAGDSGVRQLAEVPIGSNIIPSATHYGARLQQHAARWGLADAGTVVGYFGGRAGSSDPTDLDYAADLDSLADQLGIADRIVRTGFLPPRETSEAFLACDLMAMPYVDGASFRRGTFLACLAHGMPTIATRPAVPLPQLRDGENIRLVPPEDAAALVAAIAQLSADPVLRTRLSAGATKLADQFTWDKIAKQTAAFFQKLLDSRSLSPES